MKRSRLTSLFLLACTLGVWWLCPRQPARAEPPPAETVLAAIDAFIAHQMDELEIPGLALAVVRDGEVLAVRGYGQADSRGRPVTPQTPFLVASLSKPITALGVMQLVESGQLELDAPVQASLPWFRTADPAASAQITIRHLLHHASGFSQLEGDLRNLETDRGPQALEASLRRLSGSKLNAAPGERFEYSNTNYDILGLLIQTASGKPYETYIQEKIFAPLGMQHSYTSLDEARLGGLASGYAAFFELSLPYDQLMPYSRTVAPSAGLFASADDLARFLLAQLNQGRAPDGTQLLSPAGIAALHSPGMQIGENVHYAMGWTQFRFDQLAPAGGPGADAPLALAHGGDWANYKALMLLVPEHDLGLVVLINKYDLGQNSAYEQIAWNTALLALGLPAADFPANEDFMTRYGRIVGGAVVLLLIASLVWSVRRLRADTGWDPQDPQRRRQILIFLVILPLIDLAIAGYVLLVDFSQSPAALLLNLAFTPDAGLLYLLVLGLTLGWGALRTALAIRRLFIAPKIATPAV